MNNMEMQINGKCFVPPSSFRWRLTGRDSTGITAYDLHTIQSKRLQISIVLSPMSKILLLICPKLPWKRSE